MKAEGRGAWWNQYSNRNVPDCIARAKYSGIQFVIVKASYPTIMEQFIEAGITVGVENYVKPDNPEMEGKNLARAVARGAEFAVINAEAEWEDIGSPGRMRRLIQAFRSEQPNTELYASTDTRGGRIGLPYQRVLGEYITGWMPMIYPLAFRTARPFGYIADAFKECMDRGQDFQGKPVLPTLQTYNSIGSNAVEEMLVQVGLRGLKGYQAYTIGHATDSEWKVIEDDTRFDTQPVPSDGQEVTWSEELVIGFDSKPVLFEVVKADLSVRSIPLTRRQWITLSALGLIVNTHTHKVTLS